MRTFFNILRLTAAVLIDTVPFAAIAMLVIATDESAWSLLFIPLMLFILSIQIDEPRWMYNLEATFAWRENPRSANPGGYGLDA